MLAPHTLNQSRSSLTSGLTQVVAVAVTFLLETQACGLRRNVGALRLHLTSWAQRCFHPAVCNPARLCGCGTLSQMLLVAAEPHGRRGVCRQLCTYAAPGFI